VGTTYGDGGFFLMKRGTNECAVESDVAALIPALRSSILDNYDIPMLAKEGV
jgi:hypothetical protein